MDQAQLNQILHAIDQANADDPHQEITADGPQPKELLYGRRMSAWLQTLRPDAGPALQIAARAQHIRRWEHPRSEYPMDRKGYLAWRRALYSFHAEAVSAILAAHGADAALIERVSFLLHKKKLYDDPDTQALEDAACLVFLQYHLAEFAEKTERAKLVDIIRKTWKKMSERGHQHALALPYAPDIRAVLEEALGHG